MPTIDELMDKDPLELSSKDIDEIIAYERKQRGLFEAGVKPKKVEGEKKDLDVNAILIGLRGNDPGKWTPPPTTNIRRRI